MREINKIILHHTASAVLSCREYYPILYNFHVNVRGYSDVGYHYIIDCFGNIKECRPLIKVGAHCYGYNNDSIGIALIGNYERYDVPFEMHKALVNLISELKFKYDLFGVEIDGHCDYRKTLCPGHYGYLEVQQLRTIFF